MPFSVHCFESDRSYLYEEVRGHMLEWRRTVVGFYNIYLIIPGSDKMPRVTVSPIVFEELIPVIDRRSVIGWTEVDADTVAALGFDTAKEVSIA